MDLVDEEYRLFLLKKDVHHLFYPFFEIAPEFRARQKGPHIEAVNGVILQEGRNVARNDTLCQSFGDRRFAHARLSDMDRIVLEPAAEHLDRTLDLSFPSDDRLQLACGGLGGEIGGKTLQRPWLETALVPPLQIGSPFAFVQELGFLAGKFPYAVGEHFQKLKPLDAQLAHVVARIGSFLVVEGNDEIGYLHFVLARSLGLHDSPFYHRLETGGLHWFGAAPQYRHLLLEICLYTPPELLHVGVAALHDESELFKRKPGVENMLRREILVVTELGFVIGRVENGLYFLTDLHTLHFLHGALQGESHLPRQAVHLIDFRRGDVVTILSHYPFTLSVDVHHDFGGFRQGFVEDRHQHGNNKFHGRKIVVQQNDPVFLGLPGFYRFFRLGDDLPLVRYYSAHSYTKVSTNILRNKTIE